MSMATRTKGKAKGEAPRATRTERVRPADLPAGLNALLRRADVAVALGTSLRSFAEMLATGTFPKGTVYPGTGQPRWTVAEVNAWIAENGKPAEGGGA